MIGGGDDGGGDDDGGDEGSVVCGSGQTDSACMHCTNDDGSEPSDCNSIDCIWNEDATAKADGSNMHDGQLQKCEPVGDDGGARRNGACVCV